MALAIGTAVTSIAVALLGAVVMIGALLLGAFLAFCVLLWALLRGPRLTRSVASGRSGRFGQATTIKKPGQVVDVEVREVHNVREGHNADDIPSPSPQGHHS